MFVKIRNKGISVPIIQGGMGVGISLGGLAGAVAAEGGMGVISSVHIGYREKDISSNPMEANHRALLNEVEKARKISKNKGMIAVNIMAAIQDYKEHIKSAVEAKVDAIIMGAGLPLDLPKLVGDADIAIAPIVSGQRALALIMRAWSRRFNRKPDFIIVEGRDAGGHLGFSEAEMTDPGRNTTTIVKEVVDFLKTAKESIPVFAAGSTFDGFDLKKYMDLGASGVQIGTRFIATEECDASRGFKEVILKATQKDLVVIKSPVGMLARAIQTPLVQNVKNVGRIPPKRCIKCLSVCDPKTTPYCISHALSKAVVGDVEEGLFFSGSNVERIDKMSTVKEIISSIMEEWRNA